MSQFNPYFRFIMILLSFISTLTQF